MVLKLYGNAARSLSEDELINIEWNKANNFALSLVDRNERETCLNIKSYVSLGLLPPDHECLPLIAALDAAVSGIWKQYYVNKDLIKQGLPPNKYVAPENLPDIKTITDLIDF